MTNRGQAAVAVLLQNKGVRVEYYLCSSGKQIDHGPFGSIPHVRICAGGGG
jgi:hypothetical protein